MEIKNENIMAINLYSIFHRQLKNWKRAETKNAPIADTSNIEETNEFFEEVENLFYEPGIAN